MQEAVSNSVYLLLNCVGVIACACTWKTEERGIYLWV